MRNARLVTRLLAGQALVGLVGLVTLVAVAVLVGPGVFRDHLAASGHDVPVAVRRHADEAFRTAATLSLAAAVLVGACAAALVSAYLTRRLGRSVSAVATTAAELAAGRYDARIPDPQLGPELRRLVTAFDDMAARLEATERTRRQTLSDLAHELRTPLALLEAYLEAIEDGVAVADPETLALLRAQTDRLARLARDVDEVSRAQEGAVVLERSAVPAHRLVDAAVAAARSRYAEAGVDLVAERGPGEAVVDVDAARLQQVLGNLLDNALRHTPRGGRVTVRSRAAGERVVLEVADTGEGIPAEHLVRVFERFYRVDTARDRAGGGSGIGLAISRALVEAHAGSIRAESGGPGAGTTFVVELPGS